MAYMHKASEKWSFAKIILGRQKAMAIVTVGIDLAKNFFAVYGVDTTGKNYPHFSGTAVCRKKLFPWPGLTD